MKTLKAPPKVSVPSDPKPSLAAGLRRFWTLEAEVIGASIPKPPRVPRFSSTPKNEVK